MLDPSLCCNVILVTDIHIFHYMVLHVYIKEKDLRLRNILVTKGDREVKLKPVLIIFPSKFSSEVKKQNIKSKKQKKHGCQTLQIKITKSQIPLQLCIHFETY